MRGVMILSFLSFFWEHPERKQLTKPGQADLANVGELQNTVVVSIFHYPYITSTYNTIVVSMFFSIIPL